MLQGDLRALQIQGGPGHDLLGPAQEATVRRVPELVTDPEPTPLQVDLSVEELHSGIHLHRHIR